MIIILIHVTLTVSKPVLFVPCGCSFARALSSLCSSVLPFDNAFAKLLTGNDRLPNGTVALNRLRGLLGSECEQSEFWTSRCSVIAVTLSYVRKH